MVREYCNNIYLFKLLNEDTKHIILDVKNEKDFISVVRILTHKDFINTEGYSSFQLKNMYNQFKTEICFIIFPVERLYMITPSSEVSHEFGYIFY